MFFRFLQRTAILIDDVAGLGEVASCLLENIHSQNSPFIQFRPKPGLGVFYMVHRFLLATEIVSIVHAIQSDELANIPDIGLQHVFHTVHLLYLVYGAYSAAAWRVLY